MGISAVHGKHGQIYEKGLGIEKDLVKALAWEKVTQQRYPLKRIEQHIAELQKNLTPEQVAASEKLAKEITAKIEARLPKKTGI